MVAAIARPPTLRQIDARLAVARQSGERVAEEAAQIVALGRGGAGAAFPAACFEREKAVKRTQNIHLAGGDLMRDDAELGEPAAAARQFLAVSWRERVLEIAGAVRPGASSARGVAAEVGVRQTAAPPARD